MAKIYRYIPQITTGPNGTTVRYRPRLDEEPRETFLGTIGEYEYISAPDDWDPGKQPFSIKFEQVILTGEQKLELRRQHMVQVIKDETRAKLDEQVGDLEDRVSNLYKIIENLFVTVSWLMADKARTETMPPDLVNTYGQRSKAVLDAIKDNTLPLRSDMEDPNGMINDLLIAIAKTNQIVGENYISKLTELGLK